MSTLTVVDHPLIQHRLSQMREKSTPTPLFRRFLYEIGALLAYEATRDLPTVVRHIETPDHRHGYEVPRRRGGLPRQHPPRGQRAAGGLP
jgi:uracil phosphoribosyltransferase